MGVATRCAPIYYGKAVIYVIYTMLRYSIPKQVWIRIKYLYHTETDNSVAILNHLR